MDSLFRRVCTKYRRGPTVQLRNLRVTHIPKIFYFRRLLFVLYNSILACRHTGMSYGPRHSFQLVRLRTGVLRTRFVQLCSGFSLVRLLRSPRETRLGPLFLSYPKDLCLFVCSYETRLSKRSHFLTFVPLISSSQTSLTWSPSRLYSLPRPFQPRPVGLFGLDSGILQSSGHDIVAITLTLLSTP